MKRIIKLFYIKLIFLILIQHSYAKYENKIILKIENEIITNYDIKNKILSTLVLANKEINQDNINKQKKEALEALIKFKLKKIELSNHNFTYDNNKVNAYLNSISSNDIQGLKKTFSDNGIDFDFFIDEVKTQFKWQQLIYKIYSKKIFIDENSIQKELDQILKNQTEVEEYNLSEIEILVNNDNSDLEKILNIENQIKKYGFEITAAKFSNSSTSSNNGKLGWLNAKSLSKEIYDILKKMDIGTVSKPIKKENTVTFLKLNDKKISKLKNLNMVELKKNLMSQKTNDMFRLYSRSYLSKLRNTVLIEYQ